MKRIILRNVYPELESSFTKNIITAIIGARQTGKTTSLEHLIAQINKRNPKHNNYLYLNLDSFTLRQDLFHNENCIYDKIEQTIKQPLERFKKRFYLFIDEAQKSPRLFEILKMLYDKYSQKLKIVLTGSSVLEIMGKSSESLAGRIDYIRIFPFSLEEYFYFRKAKENYDTAAFLENILSGRLNFALLNELTRRKNYLKAEYIENLDEIIIHGLYPKIVSLTKKPDKFKELLNYKETYIDKDIRQLQKISDLHQFDSFLTILSSLTGRILVRSNLANDASIDRRTAIKYLSLLEKTFIVYLLQPYFRNTTSRVRKSPKIYFYDNGLVALLTKWITPGLLKSTGKIGNLFENLIITEFIKHTANRKLPSDVLFWRSLSNAEVDLCLECEAGVIPCEIKYSSSLSKKYVTGIKSFIESQKQVIPYALIIYNGPLEKLSKNIWAIPAWLLA